jgi:hypothetical protein
LQYTIIEEPTKSLWYPMWREKDQQIWKHFAGAGEVVSFPTQPLAQEYIDTWNRTFPVLIISRPYLNSIGLSVAQITTLTDEEMTRIAEILVAKLFDSDFDEEAKLTARLVLAGKL